MVTVVKNLHIQQMRYEADDPPPSDEKLKAIPVTGRGSL
jgi:hypothetical protein